MYEQEIIPDSQQLRVKKKSFTEIDDKNHEIQKEKKQLDK